MKHKTFWGALPLTVTVVLFMSCTSVAHYEKIDAAVFAGNYAGGLAEIEAAKETAYKSKDRVLYYLESGMLAHYAGMHEQSISALNDAERAIEETFTKSISMEVSTYLVNDNSQEYPGEDYEDIYLNAFKALSFYHTGSLDGALVEIRRIDNKLRFLSTRYGTAITNAQKAALEKDENVPAVDSADATVKFNNSALARYLGMLFYRADGKRDDARIDRNEVRLAFANQPGVYNFPVPSSLDAELEIPAGRARLNVIAFTGLSPVKQQETARLQLGSSNWIKIALPVLVARPVPVTRMEVVLENGVTFPLELLEDMNAVAVETFKQKAAFIYFKSILRSTVKTATSMVMKEQAQDRSGELGLFLAVASLGTQIYAEASEQADLRISRYFPSRASVGGLTLDPGVYNFSVNFYGAGNQLLHQQVFHQFEVQAQKLNLAEAICIR